MNDDDEMNDDCVVVVLRSMDDDNSRDYHCQLLIFDMYNKNGTTTVSLHYLYD